MKGVLMLVNYFPPLSSGGAEVQAERLCEYMVMKNLWVGVVTRKVGDISTVEKRNGYLIHRVWNFGFGKLKAFTYTVGAFFTIFRYGKNFDVLHAHMENSSAVAAALAGRLMNKSVIVKFPNSGVGSDVQASLKTLLGRFRFAILRRWVDRFIALTGEMEEELLREGFSQDRILRIANGVSVETFSSPADKESSKEAIYPHLRGKTLFIFVGRLVPIKAIPVLLEAFAKAVKVNSNSHLILLGDGEEREKLETLTRQLGIESYVTFVGAVEDVIPYLKAADVFILPSLAEGLSNSLLEAMSSSLACVATKIPGSMDALANGDCGLLVEPGNIDQLADALIHLLSNKQEILRLGGLARQRILSMYNFPLIGEKYFDLYRQLTGESI
jgi:L-malate glycosyltransferase